MNTKKSAETRVSDESIDSDKTINHTLSSKQKKTGVEDDGAGKRAEELGRFGKGAAIIRSLLAAARFPVQSPNELLKMWGGADRILKFTVSPRMTRLYSVKDILTALHELDGHYPIQSRKHMIDCLAEIDKGQPPLPCRIDIKELKAILAKQKQVPKKAAIRRRLPVSGKTKTERSFPDDRRFQPKCWPVSDLTMLPFGMTSRRWFERVFPEGHEMWLRLVWQTWKDALAEALVIIETATNNNLVALDSCQMINSHIMSYLDTFDTGLFERINAEVNIVYNETSRAETGADDVEQLSITAERNVTVVLNYIEENEDQDIFSEQEITEANRAVARTIPGCHEMVGTIRKNVEEYREIATNAINLAGVFPTVHNVRLSGHLTNGEETVHHATLTFTNTSFSELFNNLEIENPLVA
jgi:hypothetical protein